LAKLLTENLWRSVFLCSIIEFDTQHEAKVLIQATEPTRLLYWKIVAELKDHTVNWSGRRFSEARKRSLNLAII
jgi:hypothetical protein